MALPCLIIQDQNGLFFYQVEQAFQGCFGCLRKGGVFALGWNDTTDRRPFPLEECQCLRSFRCDVFPRLSTWRYLTENPSRHTYDFYIKEASVPADPVHVNARNFLSKAPASA